MRRDGLAAWIGHLLAVERARADLTQAALAARLHITQQWVSRVERGAEGVTLATVERLFAAVGRQLRIEVEPVGADLDAQIEQWHRSTARDRRDLLDDMYLRALRRLRPLPFVISGRLAAFLQGAPLEPRWADIMVRRADLAELAAVFEDSYCERWHQRWECWGTWDRDPRRPGAPRWLLCGADLRLSVVGELPQTITVRVAGLSLRVLPLARIEGTDPWIKRLMDRVRSRAAPPALG